MTKGTLIGEPQDGGQALIPLRCISRERCIDLARYVKNMIELRRAVRDIDDEFRRGE